MSFPRPIEMSGSKNAWISMGRSGADERMGRKAYRDLTEELSSRRTVASAAGVLAITARRVDGC